MQTIKDMTASEKHTLKALKTFCEASDMQQDLDALEVLKRHLAGSVMTEDIDAELYDSFCFLLWRFEDMLKALQPVTDLQQMHRRRN